MTEIVFNPSAEGVVRASGLLDRAAFYRKQMRGGVITLELGLSCGPLDVPINSIARAWWARGYVSLTAKLECDAQLVRREYRATLARLAQVRSIADRGEPLRIWTSHAAEDFCCFCFLMDLLSESPTDLYCVMLPDGVPMPDGSLRRFRATGSLEPRQISALAKDALLIKPRERRFYQGIWRDLMKRPGDLRLVVNGSLLRVPADFLDPLILSCFPDGETPEHLVLHKMMTAYPFQISYCWYIRRIDALIAQGKVLLLRDHEEKAKRVLRLG